MTQTARERLRQVYLRCLTDALTEGPGVAEVANANAVMLAQCILLGTDDECQTRVELLLQAAPELFPS